MSMGSSGMNLLQAVASLATILAALAAVLGGWVTARKAFADMARAREQRERELEQRDREFKWRQASTGHELIEMLYQDEKSLNAMIMLDWDGRKFETGEHSFVIRREEMLSALRTDNPNFTLKEMFVRDCFDVYLLRLEQIETAIEVELTKQEYVVDCFYYITLMKHNWGVFEVYARYNGYMKAIKLADRGSVEIKRKAVIDRLIAQPEAIENCSASRTVVS